MGNALSNDIIDNLRAEGIRCQLGYPAGKMPYLTGPVVAVNVERADEDLTTIAARIYVPMAMGGIKCEEVASLVVRVLYELRGICHAEPCRFDGDMGLFCMTVLATFQYDLAQG